MSLGGYSKKFLRIFIPLPKIPAPKNVQHLRPISILPAISKILEKIVTEQFVNYIEREKILPKTQSGFRKNHSTCSALINLFSDLIDSKDAGKCSSLVLLDFSQAFDAINHKLLIAKMKSYNFGDNVMDWVTSYMNGRSQMTKLGSDISLPLSKSRGVPQGSCLGPVLFNLYTADFPKEVQSCNVHLYADDCQLHFSYEVSSAEYAFLRINADLERIFSWSSANGLKLNTDKCSVLHIAPRDLVETLRVGGVGVVVGGVSLQVCDRVKTLGVVIDRELSFSDHVTHATQRALGRLRGLYRFRSLLPEPAKLQIVLSLVLSVFCYCYPAYGNSLSKGDAERVQRVQNSAVRFVFNLRKFEHVSPYRGAVDMMPMKTVCRILTACMVHKILILEEPQYLKERLLYRDQMSQRASRHEGLLHFPRVNLELGRRSFSYFGPKLYNDLPDDLKRLRSVVNFKEKFKSSLCQNQTVFNVKSS